MINVENPRITFNCPLEGKAYVVTAVQRISEGAAWVACPGCGQGHRIGPFGDQVDPGLDEALASLQGQLDEMVEAADEVESEVANALDRAREAKTYLGELRKILGRE